MSNFNDKVGLVFSKLQQNQLLCKQRVFHIFFFLLQLLIINIVR